MKNQPVLPLGMSHSQFNPLEEGISQRISLTANKMSDEETKNMIEFSTETGNLKELNRRGWELKGIKPCESIAGHMYRMAMLAMWMKPVEGCDMNKVIKLCLVHDFAECRVGDITPHDNIPVDEKHKRESEAIKSLSLLLDPKQGSYFRSLYEEYEAKESPEARLAKDLDIFDMVHQAFQYEQKSVKESSKLPEDSLDEFFDANDVLSRIKNDQVQSWIRELMRQRKELLESVKSSPAITNGFK